MTDKVMIDKTVVDKNKDTLQITSSQGSRVILV